MQTNFRQPPLTSYIKSFNAGVNTYPSTWSIKSTNNVYTLTPTKSNANVQINGNLTVSGSINNASDFSLKTDIEDIGDVNDIMFIKAKKYKYKDDDERKEHYGFIAQEVETYFPNLITDEFVKDEQDEQTYKTINYVEMIPLLLMKIQDMQEQIDRLQERR
jgi:hypothetical protein